MREFYQVEWYGPWKQVTVNVKAQEAGQHHGESCKSYTTPEKAPEE